MRVAAPLQTAWNAGIKGLRIVDASIVPEIPSANTNLPTLILAERVAGVIRSEVAV